MPRLEDYCHTHWLAFRGWQRQYLQANPGWRNLGIFSSNLFQAARLFLWHLAAMLIGIPSFSFSFAQRQTAKLRRRTRVQLQRTNWQHFKTSYQPWIPRICNLHQSTRQSFVAFRFREAYCLQLMTASPYTHYKTKDSVLNCERQGLMNVAINVDRFIFSNVEYRLM